MTETTNAASVNETEAAASETPVLTEEFLKKDLGIGQTTKEPEKPKDKEGETAQAAADTAATTEKTGETEGSSGSSEVNTDNLLEGFDQPWKKTAPAADTNDSTTAPPVPEDYAKLKADLDKANKILESPFIKSMAAAQASGENPVDFLTKGIKTPDPNSMPDVEIYRNMLEEKGLDETEIDTMMDKWEDMDPLTRKEKIATQKESMMSKRKAEAESHASEMFQGWDNSNKDEANVMTASAENYQSHVDSMKGQKFLGVVEMTDEIVNDVKTVFEKGDILPKKEDGTLDETEILKMVMFTKYGELILDSTAKMVAKQTYDKYVSENTVPAGQVQMGGSSTGGTPTFEDAFKMDMEGFKNAQS